MIKCEEPLSHYGIKSQDRADIIIHKQGQNGIIPLAVIECKAPEVFLGGKETDQLVGYANKLYCDYLLLTNGMNSFSYYYSEKENQYLRIEEIPTYIEMLNGQSELLEIQQCPERTPFKDLEGLVLQGRKNGPSSDIGDDTPIVLAVMSLNLLDALLDERIKLPESHDSFFRLIKDLGVRLLSYGNAGGGSFSGPYRSFLIEYNSSNQIVSFGISTYSTDNHLNVSKTVLNVAIDTDTSAHHALQLVIDDNVVLSGDKFSFYHHGKIGIGRIGSGKVDELRILMEQYCPQLICGDQFYFGTLQNNKLFTLADRPVCTLIENLISYALIRDIYRNEVRIRRSAASSFHSIKKQKRQKAK